MKFMEMRHGLEIDNVNERKFASLAKPKKYFLPIDGARSWLI